MKKENFVIELGDIVISKTGRDEGKVYLITKIIDENFIEVANGDTRKLANPKKKRIKHVSKLNTRCDAIAQKLIANKKVYDSEVYSALKNCEIK
jgi:ribosomal protein L14E/L6E/L27E